ncbi:MAG TPA: hypothetical protein VGK67_06860 [Myxococcales bacterium]
MRWKRWVLVAAGIVLAVAFSGGGAWLVVGSQALSGLAAKSVCTCLFVSERPEEVCTKDELEAQGIGFVPVTVDRQGQAVRARAFHLRGARAVFREGTGCTLE